MGRFRPRNHLQDSTLTVQDKKADLEQQDQSYHINLTDSSMISVANLDEVVGMPQFAQMMMGGDG